MFDAQLLGDLQGAICEASWNISLANFFANFLANSIAITLGLALGFLTACF